MDFKLRYTDGDASVWCHIDIGKETSWTKEFQQFIFRKATRCDEKSRGLPETRLYFLTKKTHPLIVRSFGLTRKNKQKHQRKIPTFNITISL